MAKYVRSLIPIEIIAAACTGDVEAINAVLRYYEGYLSTMAVKQFYDRNGMPYLCVDEDVKRRLETKLITKILTFKVA